ncbi:hypothetical protein [Ideonella sp. YS5]|uniref:hypothetical protein n=1 Tax=Ideonella sp. YS5 TaxID=3453714 RepID=UPI003EEFAE3A
MSVDSLGKRFARKHGRPQISLERALASCVARFAALWKALHNAAYAQFTTMLIWSADMSVALMPAEDRGSRKKEQ